MKNKIYDKVIEINKTNRKTLEIDSYKQIIKVNNDLIKRGLTEKRGYSLATIADRPYEYKGNS